jgi:hypothetical protein
MIDFLLELDGDKILKFVEILGVGPNTIYAGIDINTSNGRVMELGDTAYERLQNARALVESGILDDL